MSSAPVLEAISVDVCYGRAAVLRAASLSVRAGEVLAVLGPTGAGKTTLFRAMVGERVPSRGQVRLQGRDVTREPLWKRARAGLGYVPQTPSVLVDLTVRGNLETFERVVGGPSKGAEHWAGLVGLSHRMGLAARELSGGERRLLELARALIGRPKVIVCDEPFSGIDPLGARQVAGLLKREAGRGLAIVLADHHATLALDLCDRAVLLLDGEVRRQGTPHELAEDSVVRERYLGHTAG
ncbi:MAG: ATP-binding cassette domain-containing protein [Deltaproteobacteria bacterium]|nr:ATP-binding cassette domain-containing protein [Deltaproteobacteria bacterium]